MVAVVVVGCFPPSGAYIRHRMSLSQLVSPGQSDCMRWGPAFTGTTTTVVGSSRPLGSAPPPSTPHHRRWRRRQHQRFDGVKSTAPPAAAEVVALPEQEATIAEVVSPWAEVLVQHYVMFAEAVRTVECLICVFTRWINQIQ